ncbi:MAG TPA: ribonuclease R [Tepidisphaeraceae bacterium]|jgi:ribonuclease R
MSEQLKNKIIEHVTSDEYRPQRPRKLARELDAHDDQNYHEFRDALRELMHQGRVALGAGGNVVLPTEKARKDEFVGTYRGKKGGFGFVVPTDPTSHEDLYIPKGENGGAISGDVVRARILHCRQGEGRTLCEGKIVEIIERSQKRFVGTLVKQHTTWMVLPDGNTLTEPILAPDAASRHIKAGTKVVIELTSYPDEGEPAQGVITEVLGKAGEKDVDLKSVIVQFNLPAEFPEAVRAQARRSVDSFDPETERTRRIDLVDEIVCTIDPDDAKDYDDAISLRRLDSGEYELGVHIADVSHFVPTGSPLDEEAAKRGNSAYFPGFVIPMLPEILSNGVCSLQEGVPRLCKSAFIRYNDKAEPVGTKFANTIIHSNKRLRYREAQALIDREEVIPHPEGDRKRSDYPPQVLALLDEMNTLARRLQKRRYQQGQVVLDLPQMELKLDEEGKVVGAEPEDTSFTHTLIEMFMVEANEAVARLLDALGVPFLRRIHPEPEPQGSERLRHFVQVSGYRLPKDMDRKALQALLNAVKGKPESFAINLAVLKSLSRAEYSPESIGHYALASQHYCHFTSPIRRYADLTIHRLLDAYFDAKARAGEGAAEAILGQRKLKLADVPSYDDLVKTGQHISFTERRADDAERELRQVKVLELLKKHVGEEFTGVVTGITNFGIFVQINEYLVDGLIRYEDLMDDWWDVDEKAGRVTGQRTGTRIAIGDVAKVVIVNVDEARRELNLAIRQLLGNRGGGGGGRAPKPGKNGKPNKKHRKGTKVERQHRHSTGGQRRNQRSKQRSRKGRR